MARDGALALVPAVTAEFMPVEIVVPTPVEREAAGGVGEMVIELSGERRVRVDRHVDAEALRRVLTVLGSAS